MSEPSPWDEYAAGWDEDVGTRRYAAAAFASLVAVLEDQGATLDGARVCDFGCGTGLLTELMVDTVRGVDAVDTSGAMLACISTKIHEHGWANVRPSTTLPESTETHDLVVCSSVLGFVDDYPGAVERLGSLLAPDGLFVQWDWERGSADADCHGLSRDEIHDALLTGGLAVVAIEHAFEIPMGGVAMRPLMGVGRKASTRGE